jgi:uncharacterized membrane protein YedE/YeeE
MAMIVSAFFCGLLFGFGLLISGMTDPNKILNFLDLFGAWDPSLAVVMGAALAVAMPGLLLVRRQEKPLFAVSSHWPTKREIDQPLLGGAALFGMGWGLSGLCPGPAIENLASLSPQVFAFVGAMAVGMLALDFWRMRKELGFLARHAPDG